MKRLELQRGHVDLGTGVVVLDGKATELRPAEIGLLRYLAGRADRTVPRDELLTSVFGYRPGLRSRTVDTTVGRLRAKIELDPAAPVHLLTDKHIGYRFVPLEGPTTVPQLGPLVGRDPELATVEAWLAGEPLVVVVGPPGVGTTHFAAALAERATDPVWIDASAEDWPIPDSGLAVLDGIDGQDLDSLSAQIRDNPGLRVVLTARRPPAIGGRVLELAPLTPADGAAMALRVAERSGISLTDDDAERISVRSEGLPLAIRVRVSLLRTVPIDHVLATAPLPALVEPMREALGRCSADEIATLSELAVILGPFGVLEASVVLGPQATERLAAVRDRSLLVREGERLRLLSAVRDAIRPADPEPYWRWLAEQAAGTVSEIDGPRARAVLDWLEVRLADLDAAVAGLADPAEREQAAIGRDVWLRVRGTSRRRWAALDGLPGSSAIHLARYAALRDLGDADGARLELERAGDGPEVRAERATLEALFGTIEAAEAAIHSASELPLDRRTLGVWALAGGTLARRTGALEQARERFHAALAAWRTAGLDRLVGLALSALSTPEILDGRFEVAAVYLSDAVDAFAAAGDLRNLAPALQHLGIVSGELGRFDEAEAAYLESLRVETEAGRMPSVANLITNLAVLAHERGQLDLAERRYREGISLLREYGEPGSLAMPLASLGLLLLEQGRLTPARAACDEARLIGETHHRPRAAEFARLVTSFQLPPDEAEAEVGQIAVSEPDAVVSPLLVVCQARLAGDHERARARLDELAPRSTAARLALRALDFEVRP